MRLFFAIPLPIEIKQKLLSSFPQKNFPGIRFTPEENLHITVHFLGATSDEKLNKIIDEAKKICESTPPFEMRSDSLKTIFKDQKPVMIWAQCEECFGFEKLSFKFREALPTDENRKPNPHVTIARIRQLKKLPFDLPGVKQFSFTAGQLELWESVTKPEGAVYSRIESWNLKSFAHG